MEVKKICKICRKGKVLKCKENIPCGTVVIINQTLYVCDTCDAAFQKIEDYRHLEYLNSIVKGEANAYEPSV